MLSVEEQEKIIQETYESIYHYCLFRLRDKEAALDITQETYELMTEKSAALTNERMILWLRRVAENKCMTYLRKRKHEGRLLSVDHASAEVLNRIMEKVDDRSFGVYYETYLKIMLHRLTPKEALLCEMKFIKGYSSEQIAEILNIKVNAVNTRISRLKKKMERIIREDIPYV